MQGDSLTQNKCPGISIQLPWPQSQFILGVTISVLNMAADLALVSVLVQLLVDLVASDNIDFYNLMPAVEATPYPKSFKCFTCEQASDNYSCNRWAEDVWCPQNTQYCMTIHHFNHHGKTKFVTKRCAVHEECQLSGCRHHKNTHHQNKEIQTGLEQLEGVCILL
ncbi:ly6/PLAUR domain-containing protein 6B isoform X3 [Megalobrama amblycephala]|uniref:ly6/PLAUR domain-containing protein 6B isoform X3 n=1 Tax=Megalobrama amblycephala TaxID=75352 RepID=UPI0020143CCD|nr:ly6/PLAUR domain-containing protein 6B isoform X3 [Megalobrama amblycephala]